MTGEWVYRDIILFGDRRVAILEDGPSYAYRLEQWGPVPYGEGQRGEWRPVEGPGYWADKFATLAGVHAEAMGAIGRMRIDVE